MSSKRTTTHTATRKRVRVAKTSGKRAGTATYKRGKTRATSGAQSGSKASAKKVVHPFAGKVVEYLRLIDREGLATHVENLIEEKSVRSGRPRSFTPRMLLLGLMLIADEGTMHLSRVVKTLNGLDKESKSRLGLGFTVTRRQVEHLYARICEILDSPTVGHAVGPALETVVDARRGDDDLAERFRGFDEFCDKVVEASHQKAKKSGSIAVDGTGVESWGTRRTDKDTGEIRVTDTDARWKARSEDSPWKKPIFGFDLTVAVQVPDAVDAAENEQVELFARSIRFRPATHRPVATGLETLTAAHSQIRREGGEPGDVLVDREYTATLDGSGFLNPARALGFDPVFDLKTNQLGIRGTVHGALIIDGQPFSPATPPDMRLIAAPPVNAPTSEKIKYQQKINARSSYALVRHGRGLGNGAQDYVCPAHAGKISCPLSGVVNPLLLPAVHAPAKAKPGSVCAKKFTRFHAHELPLNQRELYGSFEWMLSMSRRNLVEGFFGNLKNEATENLKRGSIRVRGLVKTGMMTLFSVVAANLRLIKNFTPKPRRKARRGRKPKIGIQVHNPLGNPVGQNDIIDGIGVLDPPEDPFV